MTSMALAQATYRVVVEIIEVQLKFWRSKKLRSLQMIEKSADLGG